MGALLAGGASQRLGQAKCLLDFGGSPLGLHLARRLESFCDEVIVLSNDLACCAGWGYHRVEDVYPGAGPLAGLHAALLHGGAANVFLLACDLPFFHPGLGAAMQAQMAGGGFDAIIPRRGPYLEPLCAIYSGKMLAAAEAQLRCSSDRRVVSILPGFRVGYLDQPERGRYAPDELLFMNLNTADDVAAARRLWPPPWHHQ